jgi:catechol 2,3-dioxygenase-like lactoylglutathione lyase family enzyme
MSTTITCVQPVLMSRDVTRSIEFYRRLGFVVVGQDQPDEPRYARVSRDGIELHLQWHAADEWDYPNDRPSYRFVVEDIGQLHAEFQQQGVLTDSGKIRETPFGTSEFHLRDPDLNSLQFYRWR